VGISHWLYGKKEREKKEKKQQEKENRERYETMPDFKGIFSSLPNIINAAIHKPREIEPQNVPSVHDRVAAKSAADKKTKAAASKDKVDDVYVRIETAKSKNMEIIWLLQANEDFPYKSLTELIENYHKLKDVDSHGRMSVNYAYKGELREISPLNEQDLEGLANKLESGKKVKSQAR